MPMHILSPAEVEKALVSRQSSSGYWGYYSSLLGGVSLDTRWLMIPLDDHLVHRGDGVFEAIRVNHGQLYLFEPHFKRLLESGNRIGLLKPGTEEQMRSWIQTTTQLVMSSRPVAEQKGPALVRVFWSRGGGSFGTNTQDSKKPEFFVVVTALAAVNAVLKTNGVTLCRSQIPVKPGFFAQIKSCNYLPNVLMKKESVERGFDFAAGFDERGFLTEGPTENIILVNKAGELVCPKLEHILRGTTMIRLMELVEKSGLLPIRRGVDITERDLREAHGVFMVGTTLEVIPVCQFEDQKLPVHPKASALLELLEKDQEIELI